MQYTPWKWFAQAVALATLAAFLPACTTSNVRPSVEVQHYGIDWSKADKKPVQAGALELRGIVLSPTQWPLETSLKRLFTGDFRGIIDGFDLSFKSSTIPSGALEDLYDAGYVPVVARVANLSDDPGALFLPNLVIRDRAGAELSAVDPADLPEVFSKIDWRKTGTVIALSALIAIVFVLSAKEGRGSGGIYVGGVSDTGTGDAAGSLPERPAGRAAGDAGADQALLRPGVVAPHSVAEGVVFFRRADAGIIDWSTAALAVR